MAGAADPVILKLGWVTRPGSTYDATPGRATYADPALVTQPSFSVTGSAGGDAAP